MKKFITLVLATVIVAGGLNAIHETNQNRQYIQLKRIELKNTQVELDKLEKSYEELHKNTQTTEQQRLEQIKKLEEDKKKLESDLQAKAQIKSTGAVAYAASTNDYGWHTDCRSQKDAVYAEVVKQGLSDQWEYIDYIFSHESCHDPGRLNHIGCKGLGQECGWENNPILPFQCGSNDIACQVKWFNDYAIRKGGWYASYQFWLANHWW